MKKLTILFTSLMTLALCSRVAAQSVVESNNKSTPALLMGFSGQVTNKIAQLTWIMEDETNDKWFVIERAGETGGYDSIGVVYAINNNNQTEYNYSDAMMLGGTNTYRLRQVDKDGVARYSKVVTLANAVSTAKINIYPNPVAATLNFSLISPTPDQVTVQIYSLSGVVILTTQQSLSAGTNQQSVAINTLHSGNYILKVVNRNGTSQYTQPFIKLM